METEPIFDCDGNSIDPYTGEPWPDCPNCGARPDPGGYTPSGQGCPECERPE